MGFFSFNQEIAIDLGTANTIILYNDKIVVDAPSMVALDNRTGKLKAVGHEAQAMYGRAPENIRVIRPLQNGVIADFNAAEQMMRGMMKMVSMRNTLFSSSLRMVVCIPSGSTEVEIRAVRDSSEHVGGRDVYMIYEPMAAAIGVGIDVEAPEGNMIVDIGGGTTEIAVISLGGIVTNTTIEKAIIAGVEIEAPVSASPQTPVLLVKLEIPGGCLWRLGTENFAALLHYNRSYFYAETVRELALEIAPSLFSD